jgi:hypothetical protein
VRERLEVASRILWRSWAPAGRDLGARVHEGPSDTAAVPGSTAIPHWSTTSRSQRAFVFELETKRAATAVQ